MRTVLIAFLVLLILVGAGVMVGPSFVDWNRYKDPIADRLGQIVGRSVAVDGPVSFAMLPSPTLTAAGVAIGNGPGGQAEHAVTVDQVDLTVGLFPLLSGRIAVETATLTGPSATLEVGPDGRPLWPTGPIEPGLRDAIALERVTVVDGSLTWHDRTSGRHWVIDGIEGQIRAESLQGPIDLIGTVSVAGRLLTVQASLARATPSGSWPVSISVTPDGSNAEAVFSGLVASDGRAQGDLTLATPSLASTIDRLFPDVGLIVALDRPTEVNALLDGTVSAFRLNGGQITFGDTRGTGALGLSIPPAGAGPVIADVALSLNRLEMPGPDPRGPGLATLFWEALNEDSMLGLRPPPGIDATVELDLDAVGLSGGLIRQVGLGVRVRQGAIGLERLQAQLPGATDIAMTGTIDLSAGRPAIDSRLSIASGDLRAFLEWAGVPVDGVATTRLRSLQAEGMVRGRVDDFQILGVTASIDNSTISGGLAYRNAGRPGIGLRLDIGTVNLDAYLGDGPAEREAAVLRRWLSAVEATGGWHGGFDANMAVSARSLTIDGITVEGVSLDATLADGQLTIRNLAAENLLDAAIGVAGTVGRTRPLGEIDVTLSVDAADPRPLVDGVSPAWGEAVGRLGPVDATIRLIGGREALQLQLNGAVAGGRLDLVGDVLSPADRPYVDMTARVSHPDTGRLIALVLPEYRPAGPLGAMDLYFGARGRASEMTVADIRGQIGAVEVAGQVEVARPGDGPSRFDAELRVGRWTVDPWLPARDRPADRGVAIGGDGWSTRPMGIGPIPGWTGRLEAAASEVVWNAVAFEDLALALAVSPDSLALEGVSGRVFGGAFGLAGTLAASDLLGQVVVDVDADLVGAAAGPALAALAGVRGGIVGTIDLALDARAEGGSQSALIGSLTGDGLLSIRRGAVDGLDLTGVASALGTIESPSDFLDVLNGPMTGGRTGFDTLNAPFDVAEGQLETERLRLVSEAGFGEGTASLDLRRRLLDLTMDFSLYARPDAPPFTIRLTGDPSLPQRRVQAQELQGFLAQSRLDRTGAPRPVPEEAEAPPPLPTGPSERGADAATPPPAFEAPVQPDQPPG